VIGLLTSMYAQHSILWDQFFVSLGSLLVCSLIVYAILYAFAKR